MILSESQVIKKVKNPSNSGLVQMGLNYESRIKIFTEPLFYNELKTEHGWKDLNGIMANQLHPDKIERTKSYFTYPLPISNISSDILGDLYKVFDARNANFDVYFTNKRAEIVGIEALEKVNVRNYIEYTGKKVLQACPNTIVVVDKDEKGNPYIVTVTNEDLKGIEFSNCGKYIKSISFLHSVGQLESGKDYENIAYYDDTHYRVVQKVDNTYTLIVDEPHNLDYCPAIFFFANTINSKNKFNRYNPFAPVISNLAEWTLKDVYLKYAQMYGTYPVVEMAKPSCEDDRCSNGIIEVETADGYISQSDCPTCSASKMIGAGTVIQVDAAMLQDEKDVSGMFRFIAPPIENIRFEEEKQAQRAALIKKNITGVNYVMEKEAVNEGQVASLMEDRRKPLLYIANQLNKLHKWIVKTVCKSIGIDVQVHANYGTEWFLLTEEQIQKLFKDAKDAGMPESELDEIYKLLVETKYKGNPEVVEKLIIENNLNPAPYSSVSECYDKYNAGVMSRDNLAIKANFTALIKRFERENMSLVMFGKDAIIQGRMTFAQKIESIYNELLKYVQDESSQNNEAEQASEQGSTTTDS